jgi:hypothetical protein
VAQEVNVPKHDHPGWGWIALAALVLAADATGNETMSDAFKIASRQRVAGPAVVLTWATLTAHLFGLLPLRYDPFHMINCGWPGRCPHGARACLD